MSQIPETPDWDPEILATSGLKVERTPDQHPDYNAEAYAEFRQNDPSADYWSSVP